MSTNWSGRGARHNPDPGAQSALDGAVAAFLDLDTRQSYVAAALAAHQATSTGLDTGPKAEWARIAQRCSDATAEYLTVTQRYRLLDDLGRPTSIDQRAAQAAFVKIHHDLADAATAVDTFYRKHATVLEQAKVRLAAAPRVADDARKAAVEAERKLTAAEAEGIAYDSVMDAAGVLIDALSQLTAAEQSGQVAALHRAASSVQEAAAAIDRKIDDARGLGGSVRSSLGSVRTRVEGVSTRLANLTETRSALLREFSAANTRDLVGTDDKAQKALDRGREDLRQAEDHLAAGRVEQAGAAITAAREDLTEAETLHRALTDRLRVLRDTRQDPAAAAKQARFRLRDAQLLVVNQGKVPQWGSVLDAQGDRIDRAVEGLTGGHPDYWGYLQALAAVESFIKDVVDKVRDELAGR